MSKKRIATTRVAKRKSGHPLTLKPAVADGDLRSYTIRDYRLEKPQLHTSSGSHVATRFAMKWRAAIFLGPRLRFANRNI